MSFLRRLRGRDAERRDRPPGRDEATASAEPWVRGADDHLPDDEVERERALLRGDARRLDDELIQRQLRYAGRAWTPPAQGGDRRADDEAGSSG